MSRFEELAQKWGLEMAPFMAVELFPDMLMEKLEKPIELMVAERAELSAKVLTRRYIKDKLKCLLETGKLTATEIADIFELTVEEVQTMVDKESMQSL